MEQNSKSNFPIENVHEPSQMEQLQEPMTPLQAHVAFFDFNKDGIVYPNETYKGFRAIGFGIPFSFLAAIFINTGFSFATLDSKIPSLSFPIYIKNIKRDIHYNDSGIYDDEGRFVGQRFEEVFQAFAKTYPDRMSFAEIRRMRKSFQTDPTLRGKTASIFEWFATYLMLKDKEGYVHKEDIRGIYDGTIFYRYAEKNKKNKSPTTI